MKNKVVLVQPVLAHYRESLFDSLTKESLLEFNIIAGRDFKGVKEFNASKYESIHKNLRNKEIKISGRSIYYQKGILSFLKLNKPTNIIFGGPDFNFISTILISFYIIFFTKIKLHFWTHGLSKNKSFLIKTITKFLYKKSTSIFTYEVDGKNQIMKELRINSDKIFVVKNCLNTWDYGFNKAEQQKSENNKLRILFSGRITVEKRVDLLIKAIALLKKDNQFIECIIIGDGKYLDQLKNLVSILMLEDQVTFKGAVYGDSINKYFYEADIFVLPGKVGLSIIHALSYGLPVITTSQPIHSPEFAILRDGYNARLFKKQNVNNLANVIKSFSNANTKNRYSLNAVNSINEQGYLPETMKNEFIKGLLNT